MKRYLTVNVTADLLPLLMNFCNLYIIVNGVKYYAVFHVYAANATSDGVDTTDLRNENIALKKTDSDT
jgi:hypothetical protein